MKQEDTLAEWLAAMKFSSVTEDEASTGLSPLFYAVYAGRVDLVAQLLDAGADLSVCAKKDYPEFMIIANIHPPPRGGVGQCVLAMLSYNLDSSEMFQLLTSRGADPRFNAPTNFLDNACIYG